MGLKTLNNGHGIELANTNPQGLAIGQFNPHRKLIQWNIPNKGLVEMYINPQSLSITERKLMKETRTKGGYVVQYWGEALPEIDIAGTTGSGGVEGINVLRDIYRQEQIGFADVISQLNSGFLGNVFQTTLNSIQSLVNNPLTNAITSTVSALSNPDQFFSDVVSTVGNVANVFDTIGKSISADQQLIPTLGALALSVELLYDGVTFRGYFKEFRVDEKSDEMGLFRYSMKFTVTRRVGLRKNGFPWQRTVDAGPANSDVIPLSFGGLSIPTTSSSLTTATQTTVPPPNASRRSLLTG
jgi:hypothetical protein